jgi:Rad3-related DNA helicase
MLLSATLLNTDSFCREVGLDPEKATLVEMDHTFPLKNRPLVDISQGSMTSDEQDTTIPKVAKSIKQLLGKHSSQKGIIHAHSYDIKDQLIEHLDDLGADGSRIITHKPYDRDETLTHWKERNDNSVLVSVSMEEALDLKDDLARWQVLCKAPYPNVGDPVVKYRMDELNQWGWYYRTALKTIMQACGRIIRSPDDYGVTYIADSSIHDVFEKTRHEMPPWFEEQVQAMNQR